MKALGVFGLAIVSATSISCTRNVEKNLGVRLQFPSHMGKGVSSQAALPGDKRLTYVAINVHGPGMPTAVVMWDGHDTDAPPPPYFAVTVPSGADRLVQVLAVYEYYGQGGESFYYGDKVVNVQNDMDVNITIEAVSADAGRSTISGRWIDNADAYGPTGKIIMKFSPPNNRPKMVVHSTEMFGGLFSIRGFTGTNAKFSYELEDGMNLFGGPISMDDITDYGGGRTKIHIPTYYERESPQFIQMPDFYSIVGWFGPGADSRTVCYPTLEDPIDRAYEDELGTTPMNWNENFVLSGGIGAGSFDSNGLCMNGDAYIDNLSVDAYNIVHGDGVLAAYGPYRKKTFGGNYRQTLNVNLGGSEIEVEWEYVPSVVTNPNYPNRKGVDGSEMFYRILPTSEEDEDYRVQGGDGVACADLVSKFDFKPLFSEPAIFNEPLEVNKYVSIDGLPGFSHAFRSGRVQMVLCPYQNTNNGRHYFTSAARYKSYPQTPSVALFSLPGQNFDSSNGLSGTPMTIETNQTDIEVKIYAAYMANGNYYVADWYNGTVNLTSSGSPQPTGYPSTVMFANGVATFTFNAPSSGTSIYFQISGSDGMNGYSNSIPVSATP